MAIGTLNSSGYISYCRYDNLQQWFTTTSNNQTISFTDNGVQRQLNALLIEAENTSLYVRILPSDYVLYVPANESRTYDLTKVESVQIMNNSGAKLRWSGMFF